MKTLDEAKKATGRYVLYSTEGLSIACKITGVKIAYGRLRYQITPVSGSGEKWTTKNPGTEMPYTMGDG